jgi:hypothetical protein
MQTLYFILLQAIAVGCVAVPILVIRSRRFVYETWAKMAIILICVFALIWTGLEFSLIRMGDAEYGPIGILLTHARIFFAGVVIGLYLGVVMARPWKRVREEKPQPTV